MSGEYPVAIFEVVMILQIFLQKRFFFDEIIENVMFLYNFQLNVNIFYWTEFLFIKKNYVFRFKFVKEVMTSTSPDQLVI